MEEKFSFSSMCPKAHQKQHLWWNYVPFSISFHFNRFTCCCRSYVRPWACLTCTPLGWNRSFRFESSRVWMEEYHTSTFPAHDTMPDKGYFDKYTCTYLLCIYQYTIYQALCHVPMVLAWMISFRSGRRWIKPLNSRIRQHLEEFNFVAWKEYG